MKNSTTMKYLVGTFAGLALSFSAQALPNVNLTTFDAAVTIFDIGGGPLDGGFAEVLAGPDAASLVPVSNGSTTTFFVGGLNGAGNFDGGSGPVTGVPDNSTAVFIVRAWKGASTFDAATIRGQSAQFSNSVGSGGDGVPASAPNPAPLLSMPSFTLSSTVVPEPTTMALGLFGAGAFFMRRRKA